MQSTFEGSGINSLSLDSMKGYLSKSISSINKNKLNGLKAEVEFRNYLNTLGYGDHVSVGGWIARSEGAGTFGHHVVVLFPETILPGVEYAPDRPLPNPSHGLHTICSTFHQIGIHSYFCTPVVLSENEPLSIKWKCVQLGLPTQQSFAPFPESLRGFTPRQRRHNFLAGKSDVSSVPELSIPEEFSKEHLRVNFKNYFMAEISDIDGVLWGNQYTYPLEIKEKTAGTDRQVGDYFGLDVGPFVKLAFYAAKRGNLHSLFIVREIDDSDHRNLINWWFITFEKLAQYAGWTPIGGGQNMRGGSSSVIKIPKSEFEELNANALGKL